VTATGLERLQSLLDASLARQTQAPAVCTPAGGLDPRLHAYQVKAVQHLRDHPQAGLFLEMGLGKTAATLQALTPEHLPVLVVAPKRVAAQVWPVETPKWRPDLTLALAAGDPAKRAKALAAGADITVIGRDNIKDIRPGQFRTVVIDELSGFKSRGVRWQTARKIVDAAAYVWGLTGTPTPNGYMDLWAQVHLLDGGAALGKTLGSADPKFARKGSFRDRYFTPTRFHRTTGVVIGWEFKPGAREQIEEAIAPICLSMRAADYLELPAVTHNEVLVPLSPANRRVYEQMLEHLVAQVKDGTVVAANAGVMTSKLSQITAGFLYGEEGEPTTVLHRDKIAAALEVVQGTGSPVLTFYRYVWEREALLAAMLAEGIDVRTIDEPGVVEAWNRGEVEVLLAHPASAGHGLNLQHGGHTILWTSKEWSLELWEQGNGRINRQGQTHPVLIHSLVTPDSVDEAINARLSGKATVQEALMMVLRGEDDE
jgi:SNF2 family DNA or RNA helicase